MKDIQQLIKKNSQEERYEDIFPKTFIDAIKDKESGVSLQEILQGFNMYFLSYNGNKALTRCKIPTILRKEGLWITYVLYDHTVVTEWYNSNQIDDNSWGMDSNWRIASNNLVGDVSVSADGYWVINGLKTEAKAQGETGDTPSIRVGSNNKLQVSYNNKSWRDVNDHDMYYELRISGNKLQQSNDLGKTWHDISDYIASWFRINNNKLEISRDNQNSWEVFSDFIAAYFRWSEDNKVQISRTNSGYDWQDFSGSFVDNVKIKKYIGINESLPTNGVEEGTIYMKGPYYAETDTNNDNPIYRMWVYAWKGDILAWQDNGEFTSITAGVVQETGISTSNVMSQASVTREFEKIQRVFDGGRADSVYGGSRVINCGDAYQN